MPSVEATDFSGGVTDHPLNAPQNKMAACDNLLINQYSNMGKPFTRFGSELFSTTAPQIPVGAQRISTCFFHLDILYVQSASKLYYYDGAAWIAVTGPTGNNAFIGATTLTQLAYSRWNAHVLFTTSGRTRPQKLILNNSNVPEIFEAGLPELPAGTVFTPATPGPPGTYTYLYKLVFKQTYTTTGNVTFLDYGTTTLPVTVTTPNPISTGADKVDLSAIPAIVNGANYNYRTSNIKVEIFRTKDNGTVYYSVGEVANGVDVFEDAVTDTALENNTVLYTTGGVVENDAPPKCKSLHITSQNVAYYGNIEDESGQILNQRVVQAISGDVDSAPTSFFIDMTEEVVGISSTKSNTIVFCKDSVYRLDGTSDELGRGGMLSERISDTAGCISAASIVQALDGIFWLGPNAAYFTDGFRVVTLNADFSTTYRSWTTFEGTDDESRTTKFQGKYDRVKNRVWWTVQTLTTGEVNLCYVLDLVWGVKESATFTTISGESFIPCAIEFVSGDMVRCDSRGYVLYHSDNLYADKKIDVTINPLLWADETIIYYLETTSFNFGTSSGRKFVLGASVTCESTTNLSLQIISNNDDGRVLAPLAPIRYRGNLAWTSVDAYWGDSGIPWNQRGLISEKRRMPAKSLRCVYKSLAFTNANVPVVNSDFLGTVTSNPVASTATLTNSGSVDWPGNSVGYYIHFETDNYAKGYKILSRTDDVLTFSDPLLAAPNAAGLKWMLIGSPKGEILNLLNVSINYEVAGPTLHVFTNAESGEVV